MQTAPDEDSVKALKLAKQFDSFDATMRLAALTQQTEEFRDYISETQKMRAYKGRIEGPLGAKAAVKPLPRSVSPARASTAGSSTTTIRIEPFKRDGAKAALLPMVVLGALAVMAIILLIFLLR